MRALRSYQGDRARKHLGNSNFTSASFVVGCTARINEKLKELAPIDWAKTAELIVKEMGLSLVSGRRSGREVDQNAARMGHSAGSSARFDRPVGQGGTLRIGK